MSDELSSPCEPWSYELVYPTELCENRGHVGDLPLMFATLSHGNSCNIYMFATLSHGNSCNIYIYVCNFIK